MRRRAWVVLAAGLAACSGGAPAASDGSGASSSTTAGPTTTAAPAYVPQYAPNACDAVVPADPRIECGTLTVPVDRAVPDAGVVTIPVAVVRSAAAQVEPDPIVYFSGGPGDQGRSIASLFLELDLGGPRDVIVFDQRGTGASTPSLDCPEVVEPVWTELSAGGDPLTEADALAGAMLDCHDRLVASGVDLDAYDTPTTAADVEDLRVALGIDRWNLFGVSYGTTVAQEVVREHPESVRSVVLDSTYPTSTGNGPEVRLAAAQRAIGALEAANSGMAEGLAALVQEWDDEPFVTIITDPATGGPRPLAITGGDVVAGLWNAMYDSSLIPVLPGLIEPLRAREDVAQSVVEELATKGLAALTGSAEGIALSVDCADRGRLGGSTLEEAAAQDPMYAGLLAIGIQLRCDLWDVEPVDASFNDPVQSDLPALVLGDEFDPVTPPAGSEQVAAGFTNGTFVLLPGLGHGAVFTGGCPLALFHAFELDPAAPLDQSCVASMPAPFAP